MPHSTRPEADQGLRYTCLSCAANGDRIGVEVGIVQCELALGEMSCQQLQVTIYIHIPGRTYPLLAPVADVPDDVVASLMRMAQNLRHHHVVLRQPDLELLVPSPVSVVPVWLLATLHLRTRQGVSYSSIAASCCLMSFGHE